MSHPLDVSIFAIQTALQANPAAGADFDISVIPALRCELLSINFTFTTDANAADRIVRIKTISDTFSCNYSITPVLQPASKAFFYNFGVGLPAINLSAINSVQGGLPIGMFFEYTDDLESDIAGIQVGDQISNIRYRYRYWHLA